MWLPVLQETYKAILTSQGLQYVYMFLGSLFEERALDHAGLLQNMPVRRGNLGAQITDFLVIGYYSVDALCLCCSP